MATDPQTDDRGSAPADELSSVSSLASTLSLRDEAVARHRVNTRLFAVAAWLLVAVVALGGSLILFIDSTQTGIPRTQGQRELVLSRAFLDANPDKSDAWTRFARAQAAEGLTEDALATVAQGMEQTGDQLMLLTEADVLRFSRRYTEAISSYNRAEKYYAQLVEKSPTIDKDSSQFLAQVFYGRGLCEIAIDDNDAALIDFEASVEQFPQSADSWVALGDAYATLGHEKSAIDAYNEALRYVPGHPDALQGLLRTGGETDGGGE